MTQDFTLFAIVQNGRLAYEAILLAASLQATNPDRPLTLMEPQPGSLWDEDPRINNETRALLESMGATIKPFENKVFGSTYPHGNKIEALLSLPREAPFLFLDTDTLVTGDLAQVPFNFDRPTASMRREGTWPKGPHLDTIWQSLYDRFGLDLRTSLDTRFAREDWQRYLYFNAGFFFGRDPHEFGSTYLNIAKTIRDDPPKELADQKLTPWLDQIALPLVIHKLGGGRDTIPDGLMDGAVTCHYRTLPLLYARESDATVHFIEDLAGPNKIKKVLKKYEAARRIIYQNGGQAIRNMVRAQNVHTEKEMRHAIKAAGLWFR